jgi:Domain of unknown function (DUF4371)
VIRRTISDEVKEAMHFTVLADETTDVAHNSQLSVSVRYIHKKQIVERFLEFINPTALTGLALAVDIVDVLRRAGLDTNNLVGLGYDGAAAMSREFGGVQAEFKRVCGPHAIYVHCVAHAFNLTLVKASDVPAIRNALGVVSTVATFFRSSSVRTKKLDECVGLARNNCCKTQTQNSMPDTVGGKA